MLDCISVSFHSLSWSKLVVSSLMTSLSVTLYWGPHARLCAVGTYHMLPLFYSSPELGALSFPFYRCGNRGLHLSNFPKVPQTVRGLVLFDFKAQILWQPCSVSCYLPYVMCLVSKRADSIWSVSDSNVGSFLWHHNFPPISAGLAAWLKASSWSYSCCNLLLL